MPMRLISREARTAAAMMPSVMGKKPTPVLRALHPKTFCRNWVRKKNIENIAVPMQSIMA